MADKEKIGEIAARLAAAIKTSEDRKDALLAKREAIRRQIVDGVRQAIADHQAQGALQIPEAQEQIDTTIGPWWNEVISSGIFDQVLAWGRQRRIRQIPVSDTTHFLAPHKQYLMLRYKENPFKHEADSLVSDPGFELSPEDLRRLSGREDRWGVFFSIGERRTFRSEVTDTGLYAVYESGRGEWGDGDTIPFHPTSSSDVFKYVPAVCVINFAGEIKSGAVWNQLERTLSR